MVRHPKTLLATAIATGVLAYSALGAGSGVRTASSTATLEPQDVKSVYLDKCSVCHGEDGAAKTAKGRKLKMKDIRDPQIQKMTAAEWATIVQKGKGDDMDGFEKELGADMCKKLADYMRDLSKK